MTREITSDDAIPVGDYVYDTEEWDCTYAWEDRSEAVAPLSVGEVMELGVLVRSGYIYAALVPVTFDADGDPDETEVQYFSTMEAAEKAAQRRPVR